MECAILNLMRPRLRPSLALVLAGACARDSEGSGFSTSPGASSAPAETTTGSSTSTGTDSSTGTSTGSSTGTEGGSASGGTTLILDVGSPDGGNPQPLGCQGKIDFLFVISRDGNMAWEDEDHTTIHDRLTAAIPEFFATIQEKFDDFDYHILVTKGDAHWGDPQCHPECPGPFTVQCKPAEDYPCEWVGKASACDETWGAGVVFNAGWNAPNEPCIIAGGKRYLTKGQPDLEETFACVADVGASGYYLNAQALVAAVSPELNGPGGCNEGFLRDDALLFVTMISTTPDDSEGKPASWAQAVFDAKGGDKEAVVLFHVGGANMEVWCMDPPWPHPNCKLIQQFPLRVTADVWGTDYAPGFDAAADLLLEACSNFIPK